MRPHLLFSLVAAVAAAGCPAGGGFIECRDDMSCYEGGRCMVNDVTGNQFCAYEDQACPSGLRWSSNDVEESISGACVAESTPDAGAEPDAEIDAARPDANIDAPPAQVAFDVGHVSEWRLGTSASSLSQSEFVRIVNMGDEPLDLSTATFTNVIDNHDQIVVSMTVRPNTITLSPGNSAGALSPAAAQYVTTNGLVTEPAQETTTGLVQVTVNNLPPAGTWLAVDGEGTLQIGNARATVQVRVVSSGTGTAATPHAGVRAESTPVP